MKQIKLNGKKYNCPESWDDVTLRQQIKVSADTEAIQLDELKKFALLSGYAGIPINELKQAKLNELQDLFKYMSFVNTPLPEKQLIEFDFNGKHYYVGQNLVDMQFQDFISIENTIQEASGHTYTVLPTIIAIMAKQKKANGILETLDDYDVAQRANEFMDLPLSIAHSLSLFFSVNERLYTSLSQSFLNPDSQAVIIQKQIDTVESTLKKLAGKGWLTRLVVGILRYCLRYIKRQHDKLYTSTQ